MSIKMYGPAQDAAGTIVNRDVDEHDVPAYEAAGYKKGTLASAVNEADYVAVKPEPIKEEKKSAKGK